jgi:hypothetical protein
MTLEGQTASEAGPLSTGVRRNTLNATVKATKELSGRTFNCSVVFNVLGDGGVVVSSSNKLSVSSDVINVLCELQLDM